MCSLLNCTQNNTDLRLNISGENCELFAASSTSVKCLKTFACSVILLFSLFGNLAVILIVWKNERMRTTTNLLIANMAASDLLTSVFAIPRELTENFVGVRRWLIDGLMGLISCKLVYVFQDISTAVSLQSLVVIAIDRYRGVVYPFHPPLITSKVCKAIIPIIWIIAIGLHSTYFYTVRLVVQDNKSYCTFSWAPKFEDRKTQESYFIFISIILIFFPLCVILTLYTRIILELKKRSNINSRASKLRRQRQKEDIAIVKKILAIVILFIVCITPVTIMALLLYFAWNWTLPCGMDKLYVAAKYIFYSNASLNPCVYFILNKKYRQGLKGLTKCLHSA